MSRENFSSREAAEKGRRGDEELRGSIKFGVWVVFQREKLGGYLEG